MHFKPGRRTLREPALITIVVISIILGILLLFFVTQWLNEHSLDNMNRWKNMNCIQLVLFEYSQEHETLDEFSHKEFHKALEPCLETTQTP